MLQVLKLFVIGLLIGAVGNWLQSELVLAVGFLCLISGALRLGWWFYKN